MSAGSEMPGGGAVTCDAPSRRQSPARRQAKYLARQRAEGFVAVTVIVPGNAVADLRHLAETLRVYPSLEIGPLRDAASGRLRSARKLLAGADRKRGDRA